MPEYDGLQQPIRTIRLTPVSTRRGVPLPHFERVFSWAYRMQRLDWKLLSATTLDALHDVYEWWHVVDITTGEIVTGSKSQAYGASDLTPEQIGGEA